MEESQEATLVRRKQQRFYWPKNKAPLQPILAGCPMQIVAIDILILGPLPQTISGHKYIYYFSKWVEAYPIKDQEAATVVQKLLDEMFCRFSPPQQLHSDQGRQFEAGLITELLSTVTY